MPSADLRPLVYRNQGWISAVVLVDGRMAGVWRFERKGRRLPVEIEPFPGVKLTKALRAAVEHEAEDLARFLGGELSLTWLDPAQAVALGVGAPKVRGAGLGAPSMCGGPGSPKVRAMNNEALTISLQLDMSGDTLNGQAITGQGTTKTFSSWLGMIGALDLLVADGSVQVPADLRTGAVRIAR